MVTSRASIPAGNVVFVDANGVLTAYGRNLLVQLLRSTFIAPAATGWVAPTGTGSRASINENFTTTVSNPPTQAEMTALRDQVIALQKALGQLIIDLSTIGAIL
jgi:hypothetical protein